MLVVIPNAWIVAEGRKHGRNLVNYPTASWRGFSPPSYKKEWEVKKIN
jgi:hypothetical protein